MPSKKRKYNARFPAGRIKKIMQTDEDVGKVAQAVPVIISRTLELFVESLLTKAMQITNAKNAKTLSPSHMKQCILSENRFDFLKDLVKNIPDINNEDEPVTPTESSNQYSVPAQSLRAKREQPVSEEDLAIRNIGVSTSFPANFYTEQQSTSNTTSVIQYSPKTSPPLSSSDTIKTSDRNGRNASRSSPPPLIPVAQQSTQPSMYNYNSSNTGELCIDEDYDN